MPYSGPHDTKLPSNVKKASLQERKQWIAVWNSTMAKGGSETDAFAAANGVLNNRETTSGNRTTPSASASTEPVAKKKEEGDSMIVTGRKALEGSIMDLMSDVREQLNGPGCYMSIIDIFVEPPHIIACEWGMDDEKYWDIPYTMGDDGEPVVAERDTWEEVEIDYVPVGTGHYSDVDDMDDEEAESSGYKTKAELDSGKGSPKRSKLKKSDFAYTDETGKGHFPIYDAAHVRNALARLNQSQYGDKARSKVMAAARRFGIKVSGAKKESGLVPVLPVSKAKPGVAEPAPVVDYKAVVQHESNDDKGHKVVMWLKSLWDKDDARTDVVSDNAGGSESQQHPLLLFRDKESGRERFVVWYTNCYKDKHGEIIATAAHKAYADWANEHQTYPEMWLWHTKGTRWGKVDHLVFDEGLMMATGLVDAGRESWAEQLAQADTGFSHGFAGLRTKEGIWTQYVDVEISALPRNRAANELLPPMNLFSMKEEDMALDQAHKTYFQSVGLNEEQLGGVEAIHTQFAQNLKAAGIEYKEDFKADGTGVAEAAAEGTPANAPLAAMVVGTQKAVGDLALLMTQQAKDITALRELAEKANTDLEARVKQAMTPRNEPHEVVPPTQSDENIISGRTKEARDNKDWFFGTVDEAFKATGVALPPNGDLAANAAAAAAAGAGAQQ